MSLYYAMRPSDEPVGRDAHGHPFYQYTRYGALQKRRDRAVQAAQRIGGRAYEYDGEHRLIYDAAQPRWSRPEAPRTWAELHPA